ncbi:ABC transporter substrate-binding protein [Sediminibacillus massiliensis]|uniref:ABC transporter substrate-binding protein n=1 Tax=Sediminibacillus massiliensis TaxID=1926277 RepID=UPI0009886285|nr:ABC transporter substrate-binding protein [Sediminibacillus massiliensis]
MKGTKFYTKAATALFASSILLAGCGSSDSGSGASGDQVTVDMFQFKVEIKDQLESLVEQYEEENPDVNINVKTVGGGNDYAASLKSAFSSGDEPDIFNVQSPTEVEDYRDYLADLSETEAVGQALDGTLSTVTDGEEILGMPFSQEGYGLIYNKRIFEEAGINPEEIVTYEDLEGAVKTLDSKKDELGIDAVFALPGKEKWVLGNHLSNTFLAPEFNNDILEAHHSETVAFERGDEMKRFLDLQHQYSVQPVNSLDYSQQVEENFSLEKVAIIQQGNWVYNAIADMDPELAENGIGMIPIPVEGNEGKLPVGVPQYWAVNKQSDEEVVEAAKDFLDWMNTSEAGKEAVMQDFKFIPAYEGYDTSKIADPLSQDIYKYAESGETLGWVFLGAPTPWQTEVLGVDMQKYLSGDMTWEELESDATAKWEEARQ